MQPKPPEEELRRAGKAQQILEDPVFKDAVKQVEDALLAGMRSAAIVDDKLRLRLLERYELLQSLLGCLQSTMDTGRLAKEQLELQERKPGVMQRLKDTFG